MSGLSWTKAVSSCAKCMDSGKKLDEEATQETHIKQGKKETTKYFALPAVGDTSEQTVTMF